WDPAGSVPARCLGRRVRMSCLGLWDEDNTYWTGSFLVSSSTYAKSLSGHVLMWSPVGFSGIRTVRHTVSGTYTNMSLPVLYYRSRTVRSYATSWALFGHVQLLAHGPPWDAVSTRVPHYDNGWLRLRHRASRRFPFSRRERLSLFLLGMSGSEPEEMAPESSQAVGHWFSFENKTGGRSKKCFKEVTSSLKGWKKKFFLIDRRAIPDAMPWRHIEIDLRDDFPVHYNEDDVARLAEFVILLHPPPLLTMDAYLKLPVWIGTVVSKGDPILDGHSPKLRTTLPLAARQPIPEKSPTQKNLKKPNPKIVVAREKKDHQNLTKAHAKRAGEVGSSAPRKKSKVRKNQEPDRSGSKGTLSPIPLHYVGLTNEEELITIVSNDTAGNATNVEREIVDLSGNTRITTRLVTVNQPLPRLEHHDTHEHTASNAHSFHSTHHEDIEEDAADLRFVPNWGLRDDLRICTFRACKELVSHLATPVEDEFLGSLSNVEVVSRAYQSLGDVFQKL
ncbi:hypothetical protein Tco_0843906, partial [Tanacetum coccineum]